MTLRDSLRKAQDARPASVLVSPDEVRQELQRICAHPLFANAPMLQRFLRFTVEKTLEGAANELKEYIIGCDVLGRGSSFDPRQSSIVRTQAFNLRSRLKAFYESQGAAASFRIVFEPGVYSPVFAAAHPAPNPAEWRPQAVQKISLHFAIPEVHLEDESLDRQITSLRSEMIGELTRSNLFRLMVERTLADSQNLPQPDFDVEGLPSLTSTHGRLQVRLIDHRQGGCYAWTGDFVWPLPEFDAPRIARQIRAELEQVLSQVTTGAPVSTPSPQDPHAAQLCSEGAAFLMRFTPADCRRAERSFRGAMDAAPKEAQGYIGFALASIQAAFLQEAPIPSRAIEARVAAAHAMALRGSLAPSLLARGATIALFDLDLSAASAYFTRAQRASANQWPDGASGVAYALLYLVPNSHFGAAVDLLQTLSRAFPGDMFVRFGLGMCLMLGHRDSEALAVFIKMLDMDDRCGLAALGAARVLASQSDASHGAHEMIAKAEATLGRIPAVLALDGYLAGIAGNSTLVSQIQAELRAMETPFSPWFYERALIELGCGRKEDALFLVEESLRAKEPQSMFWNRDPLFASISTLPEGRQLVVLSY